MSNETREATGTRSGESWRSELQRCDDTRIVERVDEEMVKRVRAPNESFDHLFGKLALACWQPIPGVYVFEKRIGSKQPDCLIEGAFGRDRGMIVEIVADSPQDFKAKTEHALRYGFWIFWVFHVDHVDREAAAIEALRPNMKVDPIFGRYDPADGQFRLGVPISYANYDFVVERMSEFSMRNLTRGSWCMERDDDGFYLGEFDVAGQHCHLFSLDDRARALRAQLPSRAGEQRTLEWPSRDSLKTAVENGDVERLAPAGGHRPVPLRDRD